MKTNICPECGADPFKTDDYDKITRENATIRKHMTEAYAVHAVNKAEAWLRQIKLEDSMKYLQRKVKKQSETIRKLESKLRRLGEQPYKEEDDTD